jgi:hypothetical protein
MFFGIVMGAGMMPFVSVLALPESRIDPWTPPEID